MTSVVAVTVGEGSMRRLTRATLALAAVAALGFGAAACGSSSDDDSSDADATTEAQTTEVAPTTEAASTTEGAPSTEAAPPPMAAPGLPQDLAGFMGWLKLNSAPIPPSPAAPHGDQKNVYVNQTRADITAGASQTFPYPDGSIVVKEGSRGGDRAAIVAVMRKIAGIDPEHGDWEYIEYSRSSTDAPYTLLAEGAVCWTCHVNAQSTDWVYTALDS